MADYMIKGETLTNIANAIRAKSGSSATMTPEQMSTEIENISAGGGDIDALIDGSIEGTITSNATKVKRYSFYGCTNLSSVDFPNVTSIELYTCYGCTNLTSANFPNVTSIGEYAFAQCTNLANIDFVNVTEIGKSVFMSCKALASVKLPKTTTIGIGVFAACSSLAKMLLLSTTIATIASTSVFLSTPIKDGTGYVYVPNNLVADYRTATNWSTYASQIFPWVATVEELANIDSTTYTRACVGTENNGTEYTYNGTGWEVVA